MVARAIFPINQSEKTNVMSCTFSTGRFLMVRCISEMSTLPRVTTLASATLIGAEKEISVKPNTISAGTNHALAIRSLGTIEAWGDTFRSWQHEFHTKFSVQQPDLASETLEGAQFVKVIAVGLLVAVAAYVAGGRSALLKYAREQGGAALTNQIK